MEDITWKISKLKKPGIYQNPLVLRCRRQTHSNVIDKEMLIIVKRDCKTLVVNNNCNKWNYVTFLNISWPGYKNLQHKIRRRINFKWILTTYHVIYIPFSLSYMAKKRRFKKMKAEEGLKLNPEWTFLQVSLIRGRRWIPITNQ